MSTAAVFIDIEEAFYTKWHSGVPYKLQKLELSTSLITLIVSFMTENLVLVEGEEK
jgi:hypothetical protein